MTNRDERRPGWIPARTLLIGGWLLLLAACIGSHPRSQDEAIWLLVAVLPLVPVIALACRPFRAPAVVDGADPPVLSRLAAGVAALAGAGVLILAWVQLGIWWHALWDADGILLLVPAGIALLAGGLMRIRRLSSWSWTRTDRGLLIPIQNWSRRRRIGTGVTAALLIAVPAALLTWAGTTAADSSTASSGSKPVVPGQVSSVAWHTGVRERINGIYAGAAGPIAEVDQADGGGGGGGVQAYDGQTGKELWHYLRDEQKNGVSVTVTPDHTRVVVAQTTTHGWNQKHHERTHYVVLDSATGRTTHSFDHTEDPVRSDDADPHQPELMAGNDVVLRQNGDRLTALGLDDGKEFWHQDVPADAGCDVDRRVANSVLVQVMACTSPLGEEQRVGITAATGYSLATGEQLWQHRYARFILEQGENIQTQLTVSPDQSTTFVRIDPLTVKTYTPPANWIIDVASGRLLLDDRPAQGKNFTETPVLVGGGQWLARPRGAFGTPFALYRTADDRKGPAGTPGAQGWVLLNRQLLSLDRLSTTDILLGNETAEDLRAIGIAPPAVTVQPLPITRATPQQLQLSPDVATRAAIPDSGSLDPPGLVAAPGAVVVVLRTRGSKGEHDTYSLIGLR